MPSQYNPYGPQKARSPFGDGEFMERLSNKDFDICYQPNPQLKVFEGSMSAYKNWAARAVDHIARFNYRWKQVLEFSQTYYGQIHRHQLMNTHVDGVNA